VPLPLIRHTQETTKEVIYFSFVLNFVLNSPTPFSLQSYYKKSKCARKKVRKFIFKIKKPIFCSLHTKLT
jgi:hypothetical protein